MNTMHVDDFVVLGRTVPEESQKYGQRVCMAGYSPENNQFIRVYPLMVPIGANWNANSFKARHVYQMDLKRNSGDNRPESWRVLNEKQPTSTSWDKAVELPKKAVVDWLRKHAVESIQVLNECKLSLGVLHVPACKWEGLAVPRDQSDAPDEQKLLFEDLSAEPELSAGQVKYAPYIRFCDRDGPHRLQVREWGAYMLLSQPKYADRPEALWSASGYQAGHDLLLVVGNMCNHRGNWLVIKTFELDAAPTTGNLFSGIETS